MSQEVPFFLVEGDLLPILDGTLNDERGDPIDLSTASQVTILCRASGTPSTIFSAVATFSTATPGAPSCGHVTHAWGATSVPTIANHYQLQFRAAFAGGKTLTVPNPGYVPMTVGTRM